MLENYKCNQAKKSLIHLHLSIISLSRLVHPRLFFYYITTIYEDVDRQGLRKTPIRAARALLFFTRGYRQNLSGEWVVSLIISDIVPLRSSVNSEGGASA